MTRSLAMLATMLLLAGCAAAPPPAPPAMTVPQHLLRHRAPMHRTPSLPAETAPAPAPAPAPGPCASEAGGAMVISRDPACR